MIKTAPYDAMDRLEPREERYKIEGQDLWLQGSAEHVLGSMHAGEIFAEADMPVRYLGYATSFRGEAGTYGKDMEGIIRMHQFDKLEMESFSTAETSHDEHLLFAGLQEYLMQALEIPYQKLQKCTFDIGKPNAKGSQISRHGSQVKGSTVRRTLQTIWLTTKHAVSRLVFVERAGKSSSSIPMTLQHSPVDARSWRSWRTIRMKMQVMKRSMIL
jgi:hypothetical protein